MHRTFWVRMFLDSFEILLGNLNYRWGLKIQNVLERMCIFSGLEWI